YFPNSIVDLLKTPAWCLLLERIGDAAMMHLLGSTSLFSQLPNGCVFQLTGSS
ncbi:hypothetical protein BC831DRAFT_394626, partial [Entophlyctis helioformis]